MEQDQDVRDSLMMGLPTGDQAGLLEAIRGAHQEQLDRTQHPHRRRQRNADGVLVDLPMDDGDGDGDGNVDDDVDDEGDGYVAVLDESMDRPPLRR